MILLSILSNQSPFYLDFRGINIASLKGNVILAGTKMKALEVGNG
jgi:hypothetical protein